MAKGVKKIKYIAGIIPGASTQGKTAVLEPDKAATFTVEEWVVGTSEKDKKQGVTWFLMSNDRKQVIKRKLKPHNEPYEVTINRKLCGPYTYYIEASLSGELDKKPIGMYVNGYCPPKILNIEWSNANGAAQSGSSLLLADNSPVKIKFETEGLNGSKNLIVEIYKEKGDTLAHTIPNVAVVDGKIQVSINNAILWQPKVNNSQDTENFYVKLKNPAMNDYVPDGNSNYTSPFGKIVATPQVFQYTPLIPSNQSILRVGSVNVNYDKLYTCRYDKVVISDTDSNKDKYDIEIYDVKKNQAIPKYETIAGSSESSQKELTLSYKNYSLKKCFSKTHKQEIEIFVDGKKQKVEPISGETAKVILIADTNMTLLRTRPDVFFVMPDKATNYKIYARTCVQPVGILDIDVFPNVEREIAFVLTMFQTYSRENNVKVSKQESLIEYNNEKSLKLVRDLRETLIQTKGGFGVSFQAKVKVDNVESSIELAKTRGQIKKLIDFKYKVDEVLSVFDGGKAKGTPDKYILKPGIKWTFDIEPPNVALALRITNKKINGSNEIVRQLTGAIALKPIVKFKFSVDILSLLQYFGLGGSIANFLKNTLERAYEFTLYVIVEASLEAKGELTLTYNRIEGFAQGPRKLQLEAALAIKGGAKATGKSNMVTVYVPEADGKQQKVEVEKWKAEASGVSAVLYTYEINSDKIGQFSQHKLEFNGIKTTIVVYEIRQGMKYNESIKKEFTVMEKPQSPWYKSDKEYTL